MPQPVIPSGKEGQVVHFFPSQISSRGQHDKSRACPGKQRLNIARVAHLTLPAVLCGAWIEHIHIIAKVDKMRLHSRLLAHHIFTLAAVNIILYQLGTHALKNFTPMIDLYIRVMTKMKVVHYGLIIAIYKLNHEIKIFFKKLNKEICLPHKTSTI